MSSEKTIADKTAGVKNNVEKMPAPKPSAEKKPATSTGGVQCLRCHQELESYSFTKFTFLPYGSAGGNVVLECPKCGHIEFLSQNSPLLRRLNAKAVAVGDGD